MQKDQNTMKQNNSKGVCCNNNSEAHIRFAIKEPTFEQIF